jgi:Type II secretion system (T2SS), protein E, N-terminal domain
MDQRIGELLSRIIPLSGHDVEEILNEQTESNRKFGDIALSLGLAKPEHILRAWLHQLETRTERICLDNLGVDASTLVHLDRSVALQYQTLPLRCLDDELLLAVAHIPDAAGLTALETTARKRVKLVLADEAQLLRAIDRYYPATTVRAVQTSDAA